MALLVLITIWAIGFLLAFLSPDVISKTVGQEAGLKGVILEMILFEIKFLGGSFAGLRLALTVPAIIVIGFLLNKIVNRGVVHEEI